MVLNPVLPVMAKLCMLGFFLFTWIVSVHATIPCSPASATAVVNYQIDVSLSYFSPLSTSVVEPLHSMNYAPLASAMAAVDMQNYVNSMQNPAARNFPSIWNQTFVYGDQCISVNLFPKYTMNIVDYHSDTDFATNAKQATTVCSHTNNALPSGVVLFHGSQVNDDLFNSASDICNSYDVSTISATLRAKDFSRSSEQPFSLRDANVPRNSVPALLQLFKQFQWKRFAVIASSLPPVLDGLTVLQTDAANNNLEMTSFIVEADTSCPVAWETIIANDWKIIYFMPTVQTALLCLNDFHARKMSEANFIMVFSADFLATLIDNWQTLQNYINFPLSYFHGHMLLNSDVSEVGPTPYLMPWGYFLQAYYAAYQVNQTLVPESFIFNLLQGESVNIASQGILGMLGNRVRTVLQQPPVNSTSSTNMATIVQHFSSDFLTKFSNGVPFQNSSLLFAPSSDNVHFQVEVPYGALGFNLSDIFFWMTNASGADTVSLYESFIHFDSLGIKLTDEFAANLNGSTPQYFSYWSNRFSTQNQLPFSGQFYWPNSSLLSTYAHGWPSDRNPPTAITMQCISCQQPAQFNTDQAAAITATPADEAPPSSIIFSGVPNLQTVYELSTSIDNPQLYTFQVACDGTAPLSYSLSPNIPTLSVLSQQALTAPILFNQQTGQIQVSSAQLFGELQQIWLANQGSFSAASSMPSITLPQLLSLPPALSSASSIIGVTDGENNGFVLNFLLNCDNSANNFSAVLRIVTHGEPDVYSPTSAQQTGLVVANAIGLAAVCALAVGVVYFRHAPAVFSSSFVFLLIILLGFALLFISSLLSILTATAAICQAKTFTFHFGFTITLGALFAKTYRLHRIFNSRTIQLLVLTNKTLAKVLFLMVLLDAVILIIWIEVSGIGIESSAKPHCYTGGAGNNVFPAIFTGLKGILILCGINFTFKVRAVPANFNESRFIAIVIYNTAVLGILYVVVFFGTSLQPNNLSVLTSAVLFAACFINLTVFFGSKIRAVGNTFWNSSNSSSTGITRSPHGSKYRGTAAGNSAGGGAQNSGHGQEAAAGANSRPSQSVKDTEKTANGEDSDNDSDTEEDRKMDKQSRILRKVQRQRLRFLQTVAFTKQREVEHTRIVKRGEEIHTALTASYDTLRELVMKLKLNCLKLNKLTSVALPRSRTWSAGASATGSAADHDGDKKDEKTTAVHTLLKDVDKLLRVPLDDLQVEEGGHGYTIDVRRETTGQNSQRTLASQPSSRRITQQANVQQIPSPRAGPLTAPASPSHKDFNVNVKALSTGAGLELTEITIPSPKAAVITSNSNTGTAGTPGGNARYRAVSGTASERSESNRPPVVMPLEPGVRSSVTVSSMSTATQRTVGSTITTAAAAIMTPTVTAPVPASTIPGHPLVLANPTQPLAAMAAAAATARSSLLAGQGRLGTNLTVVTSSSDTNVEE